MTQLGPQPSGQQPYVHVRDLERDLRVEVDGEVRFDPGTRGTYSTDSSNYRQVPLGVVVPRTVEAGARAIAVCRRHRAPITSRGGGTSLAGQTCNVAVIIDWSKYCNALVSVDAEARSCVVEPGIVLDDLNAQLRSAGLMFGPKPSTHDHCTLGGMIGNNSCGSTAQAYGKTVDNIRRLEILTYDGLRMWVGPTSEEEWATISAEGGRRGQIYADLRALVDKREEQIRRRYPSIPRRVSGYNLDSLLPEQHFDVARALVGSEGTLVTVLRAELALVKVPKAQSLVVLGYPDIIEAADDVPRVLEHQPHQLEGLDGRLISFERAKGTNRDALDKLPTGHAWLMVSFAGNSAEEADGLARKLVESAGEDGPAAEYFDNDKVEEQLWQVREAGLGATARAPGLRDAWPGWEDSAVPPDRLGDYLRDLNSLLDQHGYGGTALYGHFGQGCVHCRIPFELLTAEGVATFRTFVQRAAELVVSYGGSLSGEHGDGQARGPLLQIMFGPEVVEAFAELKGIFDPEDRMNPGKVVGSRAIDDDLRLGASWTPAHDATAFSYPEDDGRFDRAVLRCVGVGKCRHESGGVMCPSYRATREEEHSTRGRARLLFEMIDGHDDSPVSRGWRSREVESALDLCLSCKGCKQDCPVGVDMATYKAEFLHHHYAHRLRPRAHYSMGWLPLAAQAASRMPSLVNWATQAKGLREAIKSVGGIDRQREIPQFAPTTFQEWFSQRPARAPAKHGDVLIWPDTFSNHFDPQIGRATTEVLEDAGYRVVVPRGPVCCGLTWISTGQLSIAARVLRRTLRVLKPALRAGTPIVGMEPSCTAVFRSDAGELMPKDVDVKRLAAQTTTLAELLHDRTPGWVPPSRLGRLMVQTHCHQHAIMGFEADRALLEQTGADVDVLDAGCCGLAGNFGFEAGHYDVSMAVGENGLLPAVRSAGADTVVLADGFSCRTQIAAGSSRQAVHLAQVLAGADDSGGSP